MSRRGTYNLQSREMAFHTRYRTMTTGAARYAWKKALGSGVEPGLG
jgi:hypothetical protein